MRDALLTTPLEELLAAARARRKGDGLVTYSPKVFVPHVARLTARAGVSAGLAESV